VGFRGTAGLTRRDLVLGGFGAVSVLSAAQEPPSPTFKVAVRLVRMQVTVKDAYGRLVGGLEKDEFLVTENGVPQELALFERNTTQPLSVAILVDTSSSTAKDARYEFDSVMKFVKALFASGNPGDAAALYSFNDEVTLQSSFTRNPRRIESRLRALKSGGATAVYDAIYLAAMESMDRDGRHVIVVVSDGGDTVSRTNFQQALEALHAANAVLYPVLVVPVPVEAGRNLRGENSLTTLASWTGGKLFLPTLGDSVDRAFEEILRDLRTQYLLGYYPKNVPLSKDRFHKVQVTTRRGDLLVSARNGYFGDAIDEPARDPLRGPKQER